VSVCVVPLSAASTVPEKPKLNPADLLDALTTVLQVVTDAVVNAGIEDGLLPAPVPELKLKPADPEPKPENPVKPLNAALCTVHNKHVHNFAMSNNDK